MTHCLYIIHEEGAETSGPTKIGTTWNVSDRLRILRSGNPRRLCIYDIFDVQSAEQAVSLEQDTLRYLHQVAYARDWVIDPAARVALVVQALIDGGFYNAVSRRHQTLNANRTAAGS